MIHDSLPLPIWWPSTAQWHLWTPRSSGFPANSNNKLFDDFIDSESIFSPNLVPTLLLPLVVFGKFALLFEIPYLLIRHASTRALRSNLTLKLTHFKEFKPITNLSVCFWFDVIHADLCIKIILDYSDSNSHQLSSANSDMRQSSTEQCQQWHATVTVKMTWERDLKPLAIFLLQWLWSFAVGQRRCTINQSINQSIWIFRSDLSNKVTSKLLLDLRLGNNVRMRLAKQNSFQSFTKKSKVDDDVTSPEGPFCVWSAAILKIWPPIVDNLNGGGEFALELRGAVPWRTLCQHCDLILEVFRDTQQCRLASASLMRSERRS